jgi:alpha-glucosidase
MQWDDSKNAGFTAGKPWLRMSENLTKINVKTQQDDPNSMLSLYKKLIALRKQEPALHAGIYRPVYSDKQLLSYMREYEGKRFLMILNLSDKPCTFAPERFSFKGKVRFALHAATEGETVSKSIDFKANDGLIIELE